MQSPLLRGNNMGVFLSIIAVAFIGLLGYFSKSTTYGSDLERYIVNRNPQSAGDIDRLTFEYNQKLSDERII
jgi:hypothetical protein